MLLKAISPVCGVRASLILFSYSLFEEVFLFSTHFTWCALQVSVSISFWLHSLKIETKDQTLSDNIFVSPSSDANERSKVEKL